MPSSTRYHPFYCEENLWWWCRTLSPGELARAHVLIISNPERRAAVGLQRLGKPPGDFMVWDYHVVGHLQTESSPQLIDFDTSAETTTLDAAWWFTTQERLLEWVVDEYHPLMRPIEGRRYLSDFSSTRRHMLDDAGQFIRPEPPWDPIQAESNDLSDIEGLLRPDAAEGWYAIHELAQILRLKR